MINNMLKKTLIASSLSFLILSGSLSAETDLTNALDKKSYALGMVFGQQISDNLDKGQFEVNTISVIEGLSAVLSGGDTLMNQAELQSFLQEEQERQAAKASEQAESAVKEGQAFLEGYAKEEGVSTTDTGIHYKILAEGTGKQPLESDTVQVHYAGTLKDGTEFDSSYARGTPAEFPVSGVIKGWQQILPMMKEGSKWEVAIPSELAYGERGAGGNIGPHQPLVFVIELLEIK
ncbi:MAG: FKBP-type peptidyl-prolyl cis-trans isomerase FklB [Saprospiraceae bacterium]|jgi:FKBP-type peptidyl-prolyl cis-trans isomerase FklB